MLLRNDDVAAGIARAWDAEYASGKYEDEPPIPFTRAILDTLRERGLLVARGLYVGCGNGRNYIPLAAVCVGLRGIDVSGAGLQQLLSKAPGFAGRVSCKDFLSVSPDAPLDYIISIRAFQHGDGQTARRYLEHAAAVLRPGGLLFLRVNSARTDIYRRHQVIEKNSLGGLTIRYDDGPKAGLPVHFFTDRELEYRLHLAGFDVLGDPDEASEERRPLETGTWRQWELVAVRHQ
ncbi:MAG: class I SAM-dependent methyltransferase [Thaumarchaeota archaeon]|nr:class I SAM-dependent methyltransferase [Nitrososphaerota archaeon]